MSPTEPRPWRLQWLCLAGLAAFFFLTYNLANWVTGLRHDVPVVVFGWEHRIPFLPWTIVPYWSTDLFYAMAVLLCATRAELRTLVSRLLAVQGICIAGFLWFPLRFSFERPPVPGLFGQMFDALMRFDKPFNQAPSLHVAITAVLWVAYGQHFRGSALLLIRSWFVLMALSTLTTYQHHFIDLPTGLAVGLFSMALFPNREPLRFRLGAAYFLGAVLCAVAGHWILWWPVIALATVSVIYWTGRPELFSKTSRLVSVMLAPYLAAAWLSTRWHTRHQKAAHEIAGGVWVGRLPSHAELKSSGIVSVVDCTAEFPFRAEGMVYRSIPMLDLLTPDQWQLEAAAQAIEELMAARPTLVFCALGYSRSVLAAAAWLIASGRTSSADEAIELIRRRRPYVVVRASARAQLEQWASLRVAR